MKTFPIKDLLNFQAVDNKLLKVIFEKQSFTFFHKCTNDAITFSTSENTQGITLTYFGFVSGETIHTKSEYFNSYPEAVNRIVAITNKWF